MAVYVYGLTYLDVINEIPFIDASEVGAATDPINQGSLNQWLEDGAVKINDLLLRSGITPSADLDENTHARIKVGIRSYAAVEALRILGATGPIYDQSRLVWEQTYSEISNRPQTLGGAYTNGVTTNVDTQTATYGTPSWSFLGFDPNW